MKVYSAIEFSDNNGNWNHIGNPTQINGLAMYFILGIDKGEQNSWTYQEMVDKYKTFLITSREIVKNFSTSRYLRILCDAMQIPTTNPEDYQKRYPWNDGTSLGLVDFWDDNFYTEIDMLKHMSEEIGRMKAMASFLRIPIENVRITYIPDTEEENNEQ